MCEQYKTTIGPDNILRGPEKRFAFNYGLGEYFLSKFTSNLDVVLLVDEKTGEARTSRQVLEEALSLAFGLKERGFGPGVVIGILSENRLEFPVVILASLLLGVTLAPFNYMYSDDELQHVLKITKPSLIFYSPLAEEKIRRLQNKVNFIKTIVPFSNKVEEENYSLYIAKKINWKDFICPKFNIKTTAAVVLCSSGTTGLPKGVELTHFNLLAFFETIADRRLLNVEKDDTVLGLPPFFHGLGYGIVTALGFTWQTKIVIMSHYNERRFLEAIQKHKVSILWIPPPIVVFLSKSQLVDEYDLSTIRKIRSGAAPLSINTEEAVKKRLGIRGVQQAYGMTELSIACVFTPDEVFRTGTCGLVTMGMELKIVDLESAAPLPAMKQGEVCVRGALVMKGYYGNKKATAETIENDGWLHTGDIGYYDKEGFIYIVDRLKELVKYKGFQVPPAEIESILLKNSKIKDAAVIGIPDEEAGELPFAFVVKQPHANITEEEIIHFVEERVSPQKRLRGGARLVESIPKNPTGKILRRELRSLFKSKM